MPEDVRLPLTEHLDELRKRLIRSLVAVGIGTALCYNSVDAIYAALMMPLTSRLPADSRLIFTELTEAFLTYFKLSIWGGFVLASPVVFHQIWRFIEPGLYPKEKRLTVWFAGWSTLAMLAGMAFGHFVAIPSIYVFLLSFGGSLIVPMPSMKESLSFILRMLLIFGVMFELPLFLYLLGRAGIISAGILRKGRKFAVLGVLLLAAILTPPDPISQIIIAVPLYVLYEIGILLCAVGGRKSGAAASGAPPGREPPDAPPAAAPHP